MAAVKKWSDEDALDYMLAHCIKQQKLAESANLPYHTRSGNFGWLLGEAYEKLQNYGVNMSKIEIEYVEHCALHRFRYTDMIKQLIIMKTRKLEVQTAPLKLEEAQDHVRPPSSLTAVTNGDNNA